MSTYSDAVIALVPSAYWRLNDAAGNVVDSSGNANTGTKVGASQVYSQASLTALSADRSITFPGVVGSHYSVPTSVSTNTVDTFSVIGWFKKNSLAASEQDLICQTVNGYRICLDGTNRLRFDKALSAIVAISAVAITDTSPHMFAVTKNGLGLANTRLYIDGVDVSPAALSTDVALLATGAATRIGETSGGQFNFNGRLQDVAVFKGTVLTPAQIASLYAIGGPAFNAMATDANTATTITTGLNVAAGSNRYLIANLALRLTASQTVTAVTWTPFGGAAQSLTFIGRTIRSVTTNGVETWGLAAPVVGAGKLTATVSAAMRFALGGHVFNDILQTPAPALITGAQGSTALATTGAGVSAVGDIVLDVVAIGNSAITVTADGAQTQQWQNTSLNGTISVNVRGASSRKAGAASVTTSYVLSSSTTWAIQSISLKPFVAGGPVGQTRIIPYEALKRQTPVGLIVYEGLGSPGQLSTLSYESLIARGQTRQASYEALDLLSSATALIPYEALIRRLASGALSYEALDTLATQTRQASYEALSPRTNSAAAAYEVLARLTRLGGIPYEGGVPVGATTPVSALALVLYEALLPVTRSLETPYEALIVRGQTRQASYEALIRAAQTRLTNYEALLRVAQTRAAPYEAILRRTRTGTIPYEVLKRFSRQGQALYEAVWLARATGEIPYEGGIPAGVVTTFKQTPLHIIQYDHSLYAGVSLFLDVMISTSNINFAAQARLEVSTDGGSVWSPLVVASTNALPVAIDSPVNANFIGTRVRSTAVPPGLIPAQPALYRVTLGGVTNGGANIYRIYHSWGLLGG